MSCQHRDLQLGPSPFAELAGFEQPDATARKAAESNGRTSNTKALRNEGTFPGPLVLPHDDLNYDPDCPPQDFKSWASLKQRNKFTVPKRDTLYIAKIPIITKEVDFMTAWSIPQGHKDDKPSNLDTDLFVDYLKAFYHGLNIKSLPSPLSWTSWEKSSQRQPSRRANLPKYIGLTHNDECTRIRVRSPPDGIFPAQLNLNDITDALLEILPEDAYAILLLMEQDMFESADDDFCCGRAFGGSRVAVVQTARYNPCLDESCGIDLAHTWPMSHCKSFVDKLCAVEDVEAEPPNKQQIALSSKKSPMRAAIDAASKHQANPDSAQNMKALWFSRLARTVSHEMGHCFGIGHCVYYACNMQGTAGMKEDVRQPPYLCPVCEAKIGYAIVGELQGGGAKEIEEWKGQRQEALKAFCGVLGEREMTDCMWRGLLGWLEER